MQEKDVSPLSNPSMANTAPPNGIEAANNSSATARKTVREQIEEFNLSQKIIVEPYDNILHRLLLTKCFRKFISKEKAREYAERNHQFITGRKGVSIIACIFVFYVLVVFSPLASDVQASAIM